MDFGTASPQVMYYSNSNAFIPTLVGSAVQGVPLMLVNTPTGPQIAILQSNVIQQPAYNFQVQQPPNNVIMNTSFGEVTQQPAYNLQVQQPPNHFIMNTPLGNVTQQPAYNLQVQQTPNHFILNTPLGNGASLQMPNLNFSIPQAVNHYNVNNSQGNTNLSTSNLGLQLQLPSTFVSLDTSLRTGLVDNQQSIQLTDTKKEQIVNKSYSQTDLVKEPAVENIPTLKTELLENKAIVPCQLGMSLDPQQNFQHIVEVKREILDKSPSPFDSAKEPNIECLPKVKTEPVDDLEEPGLTNDWQPTTEVKTEIFDQSLCRFETVDSNIKNPLNMKMESLENAKVMIFPQSEKNGFPPLITNICQTSQPTMTQIKIEDINHCQFELMTKLEVENIQNEERKLFEGTIFNSNIAGEEESSHENCNISPASSIENIQPQIAKPLKRKSSNSGVDITENEGVMIQTFMSKRQVLRLTSNQRDDQKPQLAVKVPIRRQTRQKEKLVTCAQCPFVSDKRSYLKQHILRKHNASTVTCLLCPFKTTCFRYLKKHMYFQHNPNGKIYACNLCSYTTNMKPSLKSHTFLRHNPVKLTHLCSYCQFGTRTHSLLRRHMIRKHSTEPPKIKCPQCNYRCHSTSALKRHSKTHRKNVYTCKLCPFETTVKGQVSSHFWLIHKNEGKDYKCTVCDFKCCHNSLLTAHKKIEHSKDPFYFKCDICEFSSVRVEELVVHTNCKHETKSDEFQCNECQFRGRDIKSLAEHIHLKHKPYLDWLKCNDCSYKTKVRSSLAAHMMFKHNNGAVGRYNCKSCLYSAKTKELLKRHFNVKHNLHATEYHCHHCGFSTKVKAKLSQHMQAFHIKRKNR